MRIKESYWLTEDILVVSCDDEAYYIQDELNNPKLQYHHIEAHYNREKDSFTFLDVYPRNDIRQASLSYDEKTHMINYINEKMLKYSNE